jgi:uncharacterized membrane protein
MRLRPLLLPSVTAVFMTILSCPLVLLTLGSVRGDVGMYEIGMALEWGVLAMTGLGLLALLLRARLAKR